MNERIQKLKRQAWDFVQHDLETVERDHAVMEQEQRAMVDAKFAELIVREFAYDCMDATGKPEMVKFAARYWGVEL